MRVKITLACTECKQRNYNTTKEKKNHPDRMETKKYCKFCKSETKQKKSWFKGLKAEFKKIIWPDRNSLVKETTAVLVVSVLLGAIIFVVDFVARIGIEFLVR